MPSFDPDLLIVGSTIVLTSIGVPIARAWARRVESAPKHQPIAREEVLARLQAIEHAVEAIAVEVERVAENQRFATRLLAGRAEATPPSPTGQEARVG